MLQTRSTKTPRNTTWPPQGGGMLLAVMLIAVVSPGGPALAQPPNIEPAPELERLHFQLGSWQVKTTTLDKSGEAFRTRQSRAEISLEHDGLMVHTLLYPEGSEEPVWRIWQYYDRYDGKLHDVSFDAVGHFEHRRELDGNDSLAFAFPEPRAFQDGVPRNWRKTYSDIGEDSFELLWHYTEDGETWVPIYRSAYRRVLAHPSADASLPAWASEEIRATEGRWIADNSEYKNEGEPYDAYGLEWRPAPGGHGLTGRLFAIQDEKDLGTLWEYRMFWHPERRALWLFQFGTDGTFGEGRIARSGPKSIELSQTFHSPAGSKWQSGHRETREHNQRSTESFAIEPDGSWKRLRAYIWVKEG